MNVAQETLGFRRAGLSPALSLLMSAFRSFGAQFEPRYIFRAGRLDQ